MAAAGARAALQPYLPRTLQDSWADFSHDRATWSRWLTGSLMHCDISGFTAMSESLAQRGKEGAELMASVLNRFFERMLDIAADWGGVQMKFGGDAMLLYFGGPEDAVRAAACGVQMQAAAARFRRVGVAGHTYELRMRVGIHSGRFFSASVGEPEGLLQYLLLGADVNRAAAVEAAADLGGVAVSGATADLLRDRCELRAGRDGTFRVRRLRFPAPPPPLPPPADVPADLLRRYLLPPLADDLAEGGGAGAAAEHRRVTVVFIHLLGVSELLQHRGDGETLAQVDACVKMVLASTRRHGGVLLGSDVAEHGDKLIVLFGAPVGHEQDEANALRFAREVQEGLAGSNLAIRQQVGVNTGLAFAGEIGSPRRREYTVIGDPVNLAARLMAAARPGEALVSASTAARAGEAAALRRLRSIRVKGKASPVVVFRLEGAAVGPAVPPVAASARLAGRDAELAALLRLPREVQAGRGRWAFVSGEAGIGKSRLLGEVGARLGADGWRWLTVTCSAQISHTPYGAWVQPLRSLLGMHSAATEQECLRTLGSLAETLPVHLREFTPLVGQVLGLPVAEPAVLQSLDSRTRRDRLLATLAEIIHRAAVDAPFVLLMEDAHWADEPTLELLRALLARPDGGLLVYVTAREQRPPAPLADVKRALTIHLQELTAEAARKIAAEAGDVAAGDLDVIIARAQGNPLFLQELVRARYERAELPETINDVLLARMDRLPRSMKQALRLAAVIGPTFDLETLEVLVSDERERSMLSSALDELTARGFLREQPGEASLFGFHHVLARDVAYETLPYAQRRRLHGLVGARIEQLAEHPEAACELLLYHHELAGDAARTVRYGALAGDRAAAIFATSEAISYYQRALAAAGTIRASVEADRSVLLERVGDCFAVAGQQREAGDAFVKALAAWRGTRSSASPRFLSLSSGRPAREAELLRKVAVSWERRSDYGESLRWLDQAVTALPPRSPRTAARVCATRSVALFRKGLYGEAIEWGRRALALGRASHDPRVRAYSHNMLANSYIECGALRRAVGHLERAVVLYDDIGDLPGQAAANNNLGSCYQLLGALADARRHYELALTADERMGNVAHAAIIHNNLGEVLLTLGRTEEAAAHLEQTLQASEQGRDLIALRGLARVNLCRCALARGEVEAAHQHLRTGIRLLERVGARGLLTEARLQLAELKVTQGQFEEARRECRRGLTRARSLNARLLEARGERILARAEAALGDLASARSHLRSGLALARATGAEFEEGRTLVLMARLARAAGERRRSGYRDLRRAAGIFARMGAAPDLDEAEELLSFLPAGAPPAWAGVPRPGAVLLTGQPGIVDSSTSCG